MMQPAARLARPSAEDTVTLRRDDLPGARAETPHRAAAEPRPSAARDQSQENGTAPGGTKTAPDLTHFYTFGDLYESIDACVQVELLLSRLQRQGVLDEAESKELGEKVEQIRARLERHLEEPR
jgi:hypothetical protein